MNFDIQGQLTDVIMCQIFSQSVQGLQSSDTPKLPFPIDLLRRPYNSVRTAVRHCDTRCRFLSSYVHSVSTISTVLDAFPTYFSQKNLLMCSCITW